MLKRLLRALIALTFVATSGHGAMAEAPRTVQAAPRPSIDLDGPWSFRIDPESRGEAEKWHQATTPFIDTITVPGAWDAQGFGEETEKLHHNHVGKGWYRRSVDVPATWDGQALFLCFGGVYREAKVWIDGAYVGHHLGYVSKFEFDVTPFVKAGQSSEVVVLVDSEQRWSEDALQGCMDIIDHLFTSWGGIWSHVSLEARAKTWLDEMFVAPRTEPGSACTVSAVIAGDAAIASRVRVEVVDSAGAPVAEQALDVSAEGPLAVEIDLPDARLWTPETPYLYTARMTLLDSAGAVIDEVQSRFGVRSIEIRGTDFFVNGKKYYLTGYGDDCVYPDTIAPPADKAFYVERLKVAKSYGFNFVRHHSHFVAPEYYEACDEVGMFVSPELPIAYPRFYNRAHGKALDLYKSEWTGAIKRYRNHPSIFDWCMSNELWEGMPRIADDLYAIARDLDSTRPVLDSDGLFQPGFDDGTKDRPTLDFLTVMFNILTTPLDNPEKFKTGTPLKPIVSHETGNYLRFPRLDEIALYKDTFKPFWLIDCRDRVEKAGLLDEAPAWSDVSELLYLQSHKINLESLRKNGNISGYTWWLLQPWYCGSNGLLDVQRRPGIIDPDAVRRFNAPLVILQDGLKQTYRAGESTEITLSVSNYSGVAIDKATLTCRVGAGAGERSIQTRALSTVANGAIVSVDPLSITLPESDVPRQVTIRAELKSGDTVQTNEWTTWVYPSQIPESETTTPVYASSDTAALLSPWKPLPMPDTAPLPGPAVYVSRQLTPALVTAAENGSSVVLLSPAGLLPTDCTTYKPAWWLGVFEGDSNAGTYVYDNPVTRGLTPGNWCDASWFHLLQGAQTILLDELAEQPEVLIRALNSPGAPHPFSRQVDFEYTWRNKSLLAQVKVGAGSLILSGLNFDVAARNGGAESAFVLNRLIEHAKTLPTPGAEWSAAFVRERVAASPFSSGHLVSGFERLIAHKGETASGQSYRERSATQYRVRQEEAFHQLEWETAPVPETPTVTFVFAGGFPFIAPTLGLPGFTLWANGTRLLDFDIVKTESSWQGIDGGASLRYVPQHVMPSWSETAGLFYLTVPGNVLTPGEACRLEVRPRGSDNTHYFGLNAYSDILTGTPWALAEASQP